MKKTKAKNKTKQNKTKDTQQQKDSHIHKLCLKNLLIDIMVEHGPVTSFSFLS